MMQHDVRGCSFLAGLVDGAVFSRRAAGRSIDRRAEAPSVVWECLSCAMQYRLLLRPLTQCDTGGALTLLSELKTFA